MSIPEITLQDFIGSMDTFQVKQIVMDQKPFSLLKLVHTNNVFGIYRIIIVTT